METKKKKFKKWIVKNKKEIIIVSCVTAGAVGSIILGRGLSIRAAIREKELLDVVNNRLKLVKDGEYVDIVVKKISDDFTETDIIRRWTKLNGEKLYLGKFDRVYDLSEEEIISKQLDKAYKRIISAMWKLR